MQKENNLTVGQWCDQWFTANRHKWNGNTEGGYRNLIYSHILPSIGSVALSDLTEQAVTDFYNSLRSQGLSARSVWCVHLLLRRCMDEASQAQLIPYNPVQLCQEPKAEEYKTAPLRLGQLQRYLKTAEQLGVLPLIYTGLSSGLRQCELITLSWADFHVRYRYILRGQRLLTLNEKAAYLLKRIPENSSPYVCIQQSQDRSAVQAPRVLLLTQENIEAGKAPLGGVPGSAAPVYGGGNMTLREYINFWQETYDKHQSRPTTYAAHNYVFKNHILPGLGDIPLSELTSEMVGEFLEKRKRATEKQ